MPQSLAKVYIHLVFSTKDRFPFLKDTALRDELHRYLATACSTLNCPAILINSVDDHVHLLFILHRTTSIAKVVEELKKSSSKWLKKRSDDLDKFSWQAGYGVFSVSESNAPAVANYIRKQEEHHQTKTFQDEYREFLQKHGIEYDENYVWD